MDNKPLDALYALVEVSTALSFLEAAKVKLDVVSSGKASASIKVDFSTLIEDVGYAIEEAQSCRALLHGGLGDIQSDAVRGAVQGTVQSHIEVSPPEGPTFDLSGGDPENPLNQVKCHLCYGLVDYLNEENLCPDCAKIGQVKPDLLDDRNSFRCPHCDNLARLPIHGVKLEPDSPLICEHCSGETRVALIPVLEGEKGGGGGCNCRECEECVWQLLG